MIQKYYEQKMIGCGSGSDRFVFRLKMKAIVTSLNVKTK